MVKWILIALSPIILLAIIEEVTEHFWKKRLNGPAGQQERKWKARLVEWYKRIRASVTESKMFMSMIRPNWLVELKNKRKQDSRVETYEREQQRESSNEQA